MAGLKFFEGQTFYGLNAGGSEAVPGLRREIRHGVRQGTPYSYLVFLDEQEIKWKIVPVLSSSGKVHR